MDLSILIPVRNEEKNIIPLYAEIKQNLNAVKSYEIIFIDDGSKDLTFENLSKIAKKDSSVKAIKFKSNYGKGSALNAGMDLCTGKKILIMDGDGQHDPKYIPLFVEKLNHYDVVSSVRKGRKGFGPNVVSKSGSYLIRTLFNVNLKDGVGSMVALTGQVKENILIYGNMFRYISILAIWKGFRVGEQEIVIRPRKEGKSKFKPFKGFKGFVDLLTLKFFFSYYSRPSHLFGSIGLTSSVIGIFSLLYLIVRKLIIGTAISANLPLFLLGILLTVIGFNFIFFGLMGDMISYNHMVQTNKKDYIIEKIV